uniref:Uncharacterized protein n=1 Tax=Cyprinus carpio TaxID=7962 RepID=A0A8C1GAT9_CYPCA
NKGMDVSCQAVGAGPPKGTDILKNVWPHFILSCSEAVLTNRSGDNRGKFKIQSFSLN